MFDLPYCRRENLSENYFIATYFISGLNYSTALKKVGQFAVGQSVGTWVSIPGISQAMIENYQARVIETDIVATSETGDCSVILKVAFPSDNFGGSFTMMLTSMVGNDVSTALKVRLIDVEIVGDASLDFLSPSQDINSLRTLAEIKEQRPLLLNMIKPCVGFSPEEGAKLFRESALGGVDLIKDDELLGSPKYNKVSKRIVTYLKASEQAFEVTGKHTIYLPNISGTPKDLMDNAKAVIDAGAKACLVNYVFGGLDAARNLAETYGNKLFIMGHYAGVSSFDSQFSGISDSVMLGILPRLAGLHSIMTMYPDFGNSSSVYNFVKTVQSQRLSIPNLNNIVTAVGGGITPINQVQVQKEVGPDSIIGIGGAIQGHPSGTTIGAKTAMYAIKSTANGVSLENASQTNEGLRIALNLWK